MTSEIDLGVTWKQDLSFTEEVAKRARKGNSIMGVVRRSYRSLTPTNFCLLFKALVRPHLEYAAPVWSPHLKKDCKALEDVQRRATKQVQQLKGLTYPERLQRLKLPTLVYRRLRGDMIEVYKITQKKVLWQQRSPVATGEDQSVLIDQAALLHAQDSYHLEHPTC